MANAVGAVSVLAHYEKIYKVFKDYTDAFNSANASLERASQIYKDECASVDTNVREALAENSKIETQTKAYVNIAQAHTRQAIDAVSPLALDSGKLARLSVQIDNASFNDRFATQLYTEATGQLITLGQEAVRLSKESEERKQELSRKYDRNKNEITKKINSIADEIVGFLHSAMFRDFLELLVADKSIYATGEKKPSGSITLNAVSIGTVQLPLPIPGSLKTKLVEATNGLYNSSTETIGIPASIVLSQGSVVIAEYSNNNEHIVLNGIQNILLNIVKYFASDYSQIAFIDPIRFNNSSLGCLAPLSVGKNSFIDNVPMTIEEIRKKMKNIISSINEEERRRSDAIFRQTKRLYVFHNFPHAYDSALISQIQQLCVNASHYGITVILTNTISSNSTMASDVLSLLKTKAIRISSDANAFSICAYINAATNPFEWYQAPQTLPQDIVQRYINEKPVVDMSNVYESRIGIATSPKYKKGDRQITNIPFGIDSEGNLQTLDFENSNFATFICGAARSGKSTLLHTIITGIIKDNHPDDVEMWLIDFKMTEFSRYIDHLPPHVRYIILDESPELVYDIIDRLSEILLKRQNLFKGKWTKLSEVPANKYMPVIFVIIDEFSVMSQIIADSLAAGKDNYSIKLQALLAKGAALGLRFIFASQGFTSGTRGLNDFSKKQVQQRIAMKTEYAEIKATLDLMSASDDDKAMMEQLPVHHALLRVPIDERGNHLLYTQVLHISDYSVQEVFIDEIRRSLSVLPKYDATNISAYIDKKTMIVDGNNYFPFYAKKDEMRKYIAEHHPVSLGKDEFSLFIGEPRRMMSLYPIEVTNSFCENIMVVAPTTEKMPASSVAMSIIESLQMQEVSTEFWTTRKHPVYRQVVIEGNTSVRISIDLEDICSQIRRVKEAIQQKKEDAKFFILLGFESFIIDMSFQQADSADGFSFKTPSEAKAVETQYEKRRDDEPDLMSILSALESGDKQQLQSVDVPATMLTPTITEGQQQSNENLKVAYDARDDLKFILTHGPKLGYHFIMYFNTAGEIAQSKIDMSLFKHKVLFRIPKIDAMTLIGAAGSGVVAELEDRSFRYTDGLDGISFRPYLHPGLSWDGWQMSGDNAVNVVDEEEEYLL